MKQIGHLIILLYIAAWLGGCSHGGRSLRTPQPSDSLYTMEAAMTVYGEQPERALEIIDSAEVVGNLNGPEAAFARARVYASLDDELMLDSARRMCEALLDDDYALSYTGNRFNVLELLTSITRLQQNYDQWLRWATQLADLCRERGEETEALRTEAEIGVVLTHLGMWDEGVRRLDQAITQLEGIRRFYELDASVIVMKRKINVLTSEEKYAETVPLAQRIIERLNDYEQHPADYSDGSYREPVSDDDRRNYCNFYRAQATGFLATAYAAMSNRGGDFATLEAEARRYIDEYEQTAYGKSFAGRRQIAGAWRELGEYDKMLRVYDEVEARMRADTLNAEYARMLLGRAVAARARGQQAAAYDYLLRHDALSQLLNDSLQASEAHFYAARYRAQEQQMEIQQRKAETRRIRLIAWGISLISLLAIGFAYWFFRQKNVVSQKNRSLTLLIDDLMKKSAAEAQAEAPAKGSEELAALFRQMDDLIRGERLYADANLQRQDVTDRLGISVDRLHQLLNAHADGQSFPAYVNGIRLDVACQILRQDPAVGMNDVAASVGLNLRNLQRLFKDRYGLTPSEYRRNHS